MQILQNNSCKIYKKILDKRTKTTDLGNNMKKIRVILSQISLFSCIFGKLYATLQPILDVYNYAYR